MHKCKYYSTVGKSDMLILLPMELLAETPVVTSDRLRAVTSWFIGVVSDADTAQAHDEMEISHCPRTHTHTHTDTHTHARTRAHAHAHKIVQCPWKNESPTCTSCNGKWSQPSGYSWIDRGWSFQAARISQGHRCHSEERHTSFFYFQNF